MGTVETVGYHAPELLEGLTAAEWLREIAFLCDQAGAPRRIGALTLNVAERVQWLREQAERAA